MWLAAGETLNASTELEAALKLAPGCQDALKLLAGLRGDLPTKKAESLVEHFKTGALKAPEEPDSWSMLGELLASGNPAGGLKPSTCWWNWPPDCWPPDCQASADAGCTHG